MNRMAGRNGLVMASLIVALSMGPAPCEAQSRQTTTGARSGKAAKPKVRQGRSGRSGGGPKPAPRPVEQGVTAIKPVPTPPAPGPGAPPPGPPNPPAPDLAALLRGSEGDPGLVTMDFRGTDVANVLKFFALATNWQIVPDAGLTGPVTIISPKQLTIDQAFTVLQSTLEVRGFVGQLEKRSNTTILKIVPLDRAVQSTGILRGPGSASTTTSADDLRNQVITQVMPIENVDAASLARELQPLISKGANIVGSAGTNALVVTDTAGNVRRISDLVQMLDRAASNNKITRFPLKRADATEVAASLNNLFRQVFNRGRGGGGQPNQPGMPPGMVMGPNGQPMPAGSGQERGAIVTVADVRTNSVIVAASEENTKRVEEFILELDGTESAALKTRIVKMKAADAAEVADTINTVLSGASGASATRGGASFSQRVFGGFGGFGGGGGGQPGSVQSTDPFAKVVADQRTNSIIITATDERMKKIDELIEVLDVQVPQETTTFVMPLKNAQAPEMAAILGQAFGTSSGNMGGFNQGFGGFNIFGQQARTSQRRTSTQRRQTGRAAPLEADGAGRSGVRGTLTATGFVPDPGAPVDGTAEETPDSRQFIFGGGFGGFGGRGNFQTPQFGRGRTGSFVNLLQLRNNVGVVADPASNSLILTTTPDNLEELKKIIETLDVVPSQVMIEVIIAEANVEDTQKLGFQFDVKGVGKLFGSLINQTGSNNFPINNTGTTSTNIDSAVVPGAQYGIQSSNYSALVQALQTDSRIRILSTPKVFTSNNQQGTIDITTRVPYVTSAYSGGLNLGQSVNYDYLDLGITLDVTPRITADGMVTIDVVATSSELLGFDTMQSSVDSNGRSTSIQAPRYSNRETNTSVTTRDGEIVAIGGLMRESGGMSTHKVPLLGDIPLLGHLFRSTTKTTSKTELMLFLVPRVVTGESSARAVTQRAAAAVGKDVPQLLKNEPGLRQGAGPQSEKPGSKPAIAPPAKP